jgi:hypothetical protein
MENTSDNVAVALVYEACPVCGKLMNEQIVMNKILTKKAAKEIEEANGKCIGYSKDACDSCSEHKDECVYAVAIDERFSEPNNPYRTGQIVGIKKDSDFVKAYEQFVFETYNGVKYMYVDIKAGIKIGLFK